MCGMATPKGTLRWSSLVVEKDLTFRRTSEGSALGSGEYFAQMVVDTPRITDAAHAIW